ncbi:hypothetical protein VTK26DRAFT_6396 [Humicola hyalothermophila]
MADSMCGPSNGAKNLLAHADRDRSLQQDRLANAPQAGPGNVFRSQATNANAAEMGFGDFQQTGMPMDPTFGPVLDMNAVGPMGHHPVVARPHGAPVPGMPATAVNPGASAPAARLASPASGGVSHQEWVKQFSSMQLGAGSAGASTVIPAQAHPAVMGPGMNPAMNLHHAPNFARPMLGSYGFANPGMNATMAQQQAAGTTAQDEAAALDFEAFERAFEEYEKMDAQDKAAESIEIRKIDKAEFAAEQDKWMAEHGPRVDPKMPPSADEMEVIDATMEKIAKEQDKKRADDELARAAVDIVNSVADNQSEKFKNSRFFELMRLIGNREVVVEGDSFVNATTGEKVKTADGGDDDDTAANASAGNKDAGSGSDAARPAAEGA